MYKKLNKLKSKKSEGSENEVAATILGGDISGFVGLMHRKLQQYGKAENWLRKSQAMYEGRIKDLGAANRLAGMTTLTLSQFLFYPVVSLTFLTLYIAWAFSVPSIPNS